MSDPVTKIATATPGGSNSATFGSIPGTFDDLVIIGSAKHSYTSTSSYTLNVIHVNMNGDTNNVYAWARTGARSGSSSPSSLGSNQTTFMSFPGCSTSHSSYNNFGWGNFYLYFPSYKVTNAYKQVLGMSGYGNTAGESHGGYVVQGTYASNSAVTSITLQERYGGDVYIAGSSMTLYGISNS